MTAVSEHPAGTKRYVMVAGVEPLHDGMAFGKDAWPLHVTLVLFQADFDAAAAVSVVDEVMAAAEAMTVRIGADARFGYRGSVRVSLVEPHPGLQELHEKLARAAVAGNAHIKSPQHAYEHYRPHVSVKGKRRVHEGDEVRLGQYALVDMQPDGDSRLRKVVALWEP
jgi:hypothetical protein